MRLFGRTLRSLPAFLVMLVITAVAFPEGRAMAQGGPPDPGNMSAGAPTDHTAHHSGGKADSIVPTAPPPAAPVSSSGTGMGMGGMGMGGMGAPSAGPAAGSVAGAGGGCGGMMGCMGGGTKPFYASLMDMPALTPEARHFIETEARRRLGAGSEAITAGQVSLHHALSTSDPATMQQAVARVREGVQQVESGASALQAINEGQQPRQIALAWFKGQASVPVAANGMDAEDGPWGLSWYHVTTMVFLIAFLLWASFIHFTRERRIGQLVQRLTPGGPAVQGGQMVRLL